MVEVGGVPGAVTAANGRSESAARLLGAADASLATIDMVTDPGERADYDRVTAALRSTLDQAAWAEGRAMTLEQAVAYALEEPPSSA